MRYSIKPMRVIIFLTLMWFVALLFFIAVITIDAKADTKLEDTALLLAQSCIGEAGWSQAKQGDECLAIWHIYLKRQAVLSKYTLAEVAIKYSACIKPGPHRRNKWVIHLSPTLAKPKQWPNGIHWTAEHKEITRSTIGLARMFLRGDTEDPLPTADHYGSSVDHWRAAKEGWVRILNGTSRQFKNNFYRI